MPKKLHFWGIISKNYKLKGDFMAQNVKFTSYDLKNS